RPCLERRSRRRLVCPWPASGRRQAFVARRRPSASWRLCPPYRTLPQPSIKSPERLAKRTLRPSSRTLKPTRVGLPLLGSIIARLERSIEDSFELVTLDEVDPLHHRVAFTRGDGENLTRPTLVATGQDNHLVALLDLGRHHST